MPKVPHRPRLADHVVARKHRTDDEPFVVLTDARAGGQVKLGMREWELLAAADGTRDLEGVRVAAAREGALARIDHVEAFFGQLAHAGFLAEGADVERTSEIDEGEARDLPIDVLPDFSLHCDGQGSCCRQYQTILFAPEEAARARGLCPSVEDGGLSHARVFLPERGSIGGAGASVMLVNGACAYLDAAMRCRVHAAGGERAKPLGCRLFPASFVVDGTSVRVSAATECACVFASIGRPEGTPLVEPTAGTGGDLPPAVHVDRLPPTIRLTPSKVTGRAELHAWSRAFAASFPSGDAVAVLLRTAEAVDGGSLPDGSSVSGSLSREDDRLLRAYLHPLQARIEKRVRHDSVWRSERDFAFLASTWLVRAGLDLLTNGIASALTPPADPSRESFYVRAAIFGHALVRDDAPLATGLRDRAARLVLARGLGRLLAASSEPIDPALREPIAVVDAMIRVHGLASYTHDVAR